MQDSLGISRRTGRIYSKCRVMRIRLNMSRERFHAHHVLPVCRAELCLTAAVLPDKADPVRRIGVFDQGPGGTGFPDSDHGNDREHAPGKVDQDKILPADPFPFQPGIDPAGHLIQLMIGNSLRINLIKKNRGKGIPLRIFFKPVQYRICHVLFSRPIRH